MTNWETERGIATEPMIDRFVASVGGDRIDSIFQNPSFQNADYVFHAAKIIIELKILETEFGATDQFAKKESKIERDLVQKFGLGPILREERSVREYYARAKRNLYRAPLARITKKANRQLRETKKALANQDYCGLLWLVNDNFRQIGTDFALSLLCSTLGRQNSSVDGLIYVTNHYVEVPGNDFANLLWVPSYKEGVADEVPDFVNWLGNEWFKFCEAEIGLFDNREIGSDIAIGGTRPIITSTPSEMDENNSNKWSQDNGKS